MSGKPAGEALRIPSLDGLRALSIGLVLVAHLSGTQAFPLARDALAPLGNIGYLGVRVFFVISGYLITTLLLSELRRHGRISLGHFYLRRAFRIFPASYTFLLAMVLLNALGVIHLLPRDTAAAASYTVNYHHERSWYIGHLWSLSVEEQFYLLWPAVLRLAGVRGGLWFAGAAIALAPLIRLGTLMAFPQFRPGVGETFQTSFDAIAAGCVLAGLRERLGAHADYLRWLRSPRFVVVPLVALAAHALGRFAKLDALVGSTVLNLAIALCIDRGVRVPGDLAGRFLNWAPLGFIGGLSYSLYLWQQPFLNRDGTAWVNRFPLNLALALGVACVSYYVVEKPFLRLRVGIERRLRARREALLQARVAGYGQVGVDERLQ